MPGGGEDRVRTTPEEDLRGFGRGAVGEVVVEVLGVLLLLESSGIAEKGEKGAKCGMGKEEEERREREGRGGSLELEGKEDL